MIGFGRRTTPEPFVNACHTFVYLENLGEQASGEAGRAAGADQADQAEPGGGECSLTRVTVEGAGASAAALAGGAGVQPLVQPPQTYTEYVCPACGKPLKQVRREGDKLFMRQHVPKKPEPPLAGSKLCRGGGDIQIGAPAMEVRETRLKTK